MKVDKTVETPEGKIQFVGELSEKETDLVVQMGLNALLMMGAITAKIAEKPAEDDDGLEEGATLQ